MIGFAPLWVALVTSVESACPCAGPRDYCPWNGFRPPRPHRRTLAPRPANRTKKPPSASNGCSTVRANKPWLRLPRAGGALVSHLGQHPKNKRSRKARWVRYFLATAFCCLSDAKGLAGMTREWGHGNSEDRTCHSTNPHSRWGQVVLPRSSPLICANLRATSPLPNCCGPQMSADNRCRLGYLLFKKERKNLFSSQIQDGSRMEFNQCFLPSDPAR